MGLIIQIGTKYEKISSELIYIEKNEFRLNISNTNLRSQQQNLIKTDRELKFRHFTVVLFLFFISLTVVKNVHQNLMASASTYLLSIYWNVDAIAKISMSNTFQYKIWHFFPSCSFNGSAIRKTAMTTTSDILCWIECS